MMTLKTYRIILELAKEAQEQRYNDWVKAHKETVMAKNNENTTMEELRKLKEKEEELHDRWFRGGVSDAIHEFEKEENIFLSWR